jgi:hypothetical protein
MSGFVSRLSKGRRRRGISDSDSYGFGLETVYAFFYFPVFIDRPGEESFSAVQKISAARCSNLKKEWL